MAKRRKRREEEPKEETRKQQRMRARDRERNRRTLLIVGGAIGLALLLIIFGALNEFVFKPNSALAKVEDHTIVTRDFWKRTRLREAQLQNQLLQLQLFSQQFGGQNIFASQISQIQATLASPLSLGTQVLNEMIEEEVIRIKAAEMGVTVTDEEVEEALKEEVAAGEGAVTVPQATATAEAAVAATATAAVWTPTPTATVDANAAITDTESITPTAEIPTPEPPPILDDALYQEGLNRLAEQLKASGMTVDEYREVIRARLLREKMQEIIGSERVEPTEEAVHVRHILIRVDETATVTETQGITGTTTTGRSDAEALALAQELRQRILDGEDFATLAEQYSDDPGSAAEGGDLGWSPRGRFVPEFEDAAFSLPVGEVSEPVKTQFGYHLIQVLERDENRPKDDAQLEQEKAQAFQAWLQEQIVAMNIQRPDDLPSKLPPGLGQSAAQP